MDTHDTPEKRVADEEAIVAARAVAFDNDGGDIQEKAPHGMRPKGVEMKREMTKEDKELADAGYEHLKHQNNAGQKEGDAKLDGVDIHEHGLGFQELQTELDTTFDAKDPSISPGLSSEEAKARLSRNGPNILTPPKKKSALRKVRNLTAHESMSDSHAANGQYYDCLMSMFNILLIIAGILEYILLGVDFKVSSSDDCGRYPL